jgi:hypothetical protein
MWRRDSTAAVAYYGGLPTAGKDHSAGQAAVEVGMYYGGRVVQEERDGAVAKRVPRLLHTRDSHSHSTQLSRSY